MNNTIKILAIDPGPVLSAYVVWDGKQILAKRIVANENMLRYITPELDFVIIEMVACYGMPVGASTFETVFWIGRFYQFSGDHLGVGRAYRKDIKMHFCNSMRAKDSNIRQALIDRFGAPGIKKAPGLTYGVKKDIWSALAIGVFYYDTQIKGVR